MKELLRNIATKKEEHQEKLVAVFIGSKEYEFSGNWQWDLQSNAVYCSDVMLFSPAAFEGTKGLIHPDDKVLVLDRISDSSSTVPFLQFRLITTYGEVKLLTGKALQFCEVVPSFNADEEIQEPLKEAYHLSKQSQKLQWQARAAAITEGITATGTWYLNTVTNEMYFSDGVYRIHGLPAQSLNPHLYTFSSFIHPDDRGTITDVIARSIQYKLPLHIEYRIQAGNGIEKKLRQTTHWEFTDTGALMLYGSVADITHQTATERRGETAEYELSLKSRLLHMNEQVTGTGYWYINLLTRKIVYSDNVYRLHGLKPNSLPAGTNIFLNFIHPEDREVVKEITKKIIRSHEPPDIDFRVIRKDGSIRYIRQRGKMVVYGEGEMVMIVSLQDITKEKVVERKSAELNETVLVKNFIQAQVEAAAGAGSWLWEVESGAITWSDGLYHLLGYRPSATTLTYKSFLRFIHTDDRKAVTSSIELLLQEKKEIEFPFRIIRLGEERYIQASFKLVANSAKELFIATLHDVTISHRMKEQLAKQVQLTESISHNTEDAVFITDENNNILLWNRACEAQFKLRREEALHRNFFDVLPHLKEETTLTQFGQALKGQPVVSHANQWAGGRGYYNLIMVPLRDNEGAVNGILHLLHDVTKEQGMERRLTERLHFIERLLEASVDRIVVLDRHMNYLYCNKKASDHFGVDKEELIGKNVLEVFPSSVITPSYEYFRKALQGDTVHIPAIEGLLEEYYGQVYLVPVKDNAGDVSAVMWMWQDLSGEIKLQRQLKKSDEILKSINAAFIELDNDCHCKYINPNGELFFGRPKEAILGKVLWDAFPQMAGTKGYDAILKAVNDQVKTEVEFFSVVFNKWVFMSATPSAEGVIIFVYDRQDIKEAQQKLQEEHRRMHEAQAIGRIGSFEWTAGEKEVLWSDELYRINGLEPQSEKITIDKTIGLVHPADWGGFQKVQERAAITPGSYKHIHRIVNPDGTVKWVNQQFQSTPNAEGKVVRVHGTLQDITAQRQREAEITKALTILQQAEDLAQIGSWEYDIASGDFTWSDGMYGLFGLPKGKKVYPGIYQEFAFHDDRDLAKKMIDTIQKGYETLDEIVRINKGGELRTLKVKSSVLRNDLGQPVKVVGVDLDITEALNAENKIQEGRHLLLQTTASAPDAISIFDLDRKEPVYLNACLATWLGYTDAELVAMGFEGRLQLIHPDDRGSLVAFIQLMQTVADGVIETLEYRVQTKEGNYIWLRNRGKVFKRDEAGKPVQILSILQDITSEVDLHKQVMERTRFVEALVENNVNRIAAFDTELRITNWNKRCEEEVGKTKEEVLGKCLLDVFPNMANDEEIMNAFEKSKMGGTVHVPIKESISGKYFELFYIPLKDETARVYGILTIGNEITGRVLHSEELKKLNESLEQKNKELEVKNGEITDFAFIASHDLKEPIRKLHTFSSWLLEKEAGGLSDRGKEFVYKMDGAVKRMDVLLADITTLTKVQAVKEAGQTVELNTIIKEVETELSDEIKEANATIKSADLPVVTGSKKQLLHLFKNIISNAVKFQQPGVPPVVEIHANRVHDVEGLPSGAYLKISFTDNGIGFDAKYASKIFKVFQRLHPQTQYAGTGIGLAICKKIMENHKGHIRAESAQNKGAVFCCYFPL